MTNKIVLGVLILSVFANTLFAQSNKSSEIYRTILAKDSLLFEVGFNQCDIGQFENLLSENLKFFHDKDGISNKEKFITDLKKGICNNVENRKVKRILIKDKTEIFPLYRNGLLYGAVQNGEHTFSEARENQGGIAKFSNIWQLENEQWKLTESFSFDHQPLSTQQKNTSILANDSVIQNWLSEYNIKTLGLGIIENGKLSQIKVFGEISEGNSAPYNTIFNVASLTKPITAMVTLKLISLGKWNLDEPLYKYYIDPDLANDSRNKLLTTRHILSHQTGFANWRSDNENKKLHFISEPGTKYGYSGEGFEYLRKALEKKFKKPFEKIAEELIFKPLKMKDTDFVWSRKTDESRFAIGYNEIGEPYKTIKNTKANAADDLYTTIEDYGNFLVDILDGGNLSEKIYQEMLKKQSKIKENQYFGLGWVLYDLGNSEFAISHSGADNGTQCLVVLLPNTKQGVIIFTNSDNGNKIYEKILTNYLGDYGRKIIKIENK